MAAGPSWAVLPSVIIVEILSYLSHRDRLKVSALCKRWRSCLFHPSLWPRVLFDLSNVHKRQRAKFLTDRCGHFVRETAVKFNSHNVTEVRETLRILNILAENKNIQSLSLQPSGCHLEWPDTQQFHVIDRYVDSIIQLVKHSRKLCHFSLGCVEELLEHSDTFVEVLSRNHSSSLKSLHLASVKEDSENYGIIDLNIINFERFKALQHLSIDYDFLTNNLLRLFTDGQRAKLEKLCVHVHGVEPGHEKITDETWRSLKNHCTGLEVTLNLIHSYEGVTSLLDILTPNMPLSHFRQFFCSELNLAAIDFISSNCGDSLKSMHIIDGLQEGQPNIYVSMTAEDPFVMMAWRCPLLENLTLIGYDLSDDEMVAIARLRGKTLKQFNIPHCCISTVYEQPVGSYERFVSGAVGPEFARMISRSLGREWHPLNDNQLPLAVFDGQADAEVAYMDILLKDQSPPDQKQTVSCVQ